MYLDDLQLQTIQWSMLHEPGDALARKLFELRGPGAIDDFRSGRAKRLWSELIALEAPEYLIKIPELIERLKLRLDYCNPHQAVERGIRWGARPLFPEQSPLAWGRFGDLALHQPYLLWIAGEVSVMEQEFAAVIGTRNPSEKGVKNAARVVSSVGLPIVSGGAKGIDAAAHRAALDLGVPTVAFMAGGIDRAYPMENWDLFHQIVRSGGALVSEMQPGASPSRFRFLQRNRLIAATGAFTVVIEAGYRSGSRNTANHARGLGRDVFAISGGWSDKSSQGCNAMINEGLAQPWDFTNLTEPTLEQKRILDAIREGCVEPAEIARESGMGISHVIRELRSLRLAGEIA